MLTMQQRRELASRAKTYRENIDKYHQSLIKPIETYQPKQEKNFLQKVGATIGDIAGNAITGASKGLEGLLDLGAGFVGSVGGIFDQNFQNNVQDFIARDFTTEYVSSTFDKATEGSYLDDAGWFGDFVENVASGVGQMLPAVAMNIVVPGSGLAVMTASATGSGMEEAYKDGAGYYEGMLYGGVSGAVEAGTEYLGGKLFGSTPIDEALGLKKPTKTLFKEAATKGGKILQNMASEGIEEGLAELANPLTKTIYKGPESLKEYGEGDYWLGVGESALVGAGTSFVFGETVGRINRTSNNLKKSLSELQQIDAAEDKFFAENTLKENQSKIDEQRSKVFDDINKELSGLKPEAKAKFTERLKQQGIEFNDDGTVKNSLNQNTAKNTLITEENLKDEQIINNNAETIENESEFQANNIKNSNIQDNVEAESPNIENFKMDNENVNSGVENFNTDAYSPRLKGKESTLAYKPTSIELSEEQIKAKQTFGKLNKGRIRTSLVFSDAMPDDIDGAYKNGVLYINSKANATEVVIKHELTHFAEGTKEYSKYAKFILDEIGNNPVLAEKFGDLQSKINSTTELYQKVIQNKTLNQQEYEILTEVVAQYTSENLFTNEAQIERLSRTNRTFVQKVFDWIKDQITSFREKRNMSAEEKMTYNFLQKAEQLYSKALDNAFGAAELTNISSVDKENQTRYSFNNGENDYGREQRSSIYGIDETRNARQDNQRKDTKRMERRLGNNSSEQWSIDRYSNKFIESIKNGTNELFEYKDRQRYGEFLKGKTQLIKLKNGWEFDIVQNQDYAKVLNELKEENSKLGINTEFFVGEIKNQKPIKIIDQNGNEVLLKTIACYYPSNNTIYLPIDNSIDFVELNRHERFHYLSRNKNFYAISEFKKNIFSAITNNEVKTIDKQYFIKYPQYKNDFFNKFEEIAGDVYSGRLELENTQARDQAKEKLDDAIKKEFGLDEIRYSLKKDSLGNNLSEEQQEFFKDSKVRDENGNLLVVYHGTDAKFNIFDKSKNVEGNNAFWFSKSKEYAEEMAIVKQGKRIDTFYLNISNPLKVKLSVKDFADNVKEERYIKQALLNNNDGVIFEEDVKDGDVFYAVFNSNQIKNIDNKNPTLSDDIRFSLNGKISQEQAKNNQKKVYNKLEAEKVINDVLNEIGLENKTLNISGLTKKQAIEKLWVALNTKEPGYRGNVALEIAEYILNNSVVESMFEDELLQDNMEVLSIYRKYLHKLNLSQIKGEIKYRFDKDNSPFLLWQARHGEKGISPDVALQEISMERYGLYVDEFFNDAECFFEIHDGYKSALESTKKKHKELLNDVASKEERKVLKQQIAKEIMLAYDKYGTKSKFSDVVEKYENKIDDLKKELAVIKEINKVKNQVLDKIQKFRDVKLGTFVNSSEYKPELFKKTIGKLANIKFRGDINKSGTREILADLKEWYSKDNQQIEYNEEIADMLETVANGKGELNITELKIIGTVIDYFKHTIENYNKVYRNGKYVDAKYIAENYIKIMESNKGIKVGLLARFANSKYFKFFGDTLSVVRRADNYHDDGFFTETFRELQQAAINAEVTKMNLRTELDKFKEKYKKYFKEIEKQEVEFNGQKIPKDEAMLLYMSHKRTQAQAGLLLSGIKFESNNEPVRINGIYQGQEIAKEDYVDLANMEAKKLYNQFSEADKEYIKIAEKLFNEDCKDLKRKTDLQREGYSNVLEYEYYVPIRRSYVARNIDTSDYIEELNRASNASFNKDAVKGTKSELYIEPLSRVLERHIDAIAMYSNMAVAIDNYNRIFNIDISGNKNKPVNIASVSSNIWKEGNQYFKNLISDIQGISKNKDGSSRFIGKIRGNYAKFQLGANPKVWVTQLSSYLASFNVLSFKSMIKGFGVKVSAADLDKYCGLAKLRDYDNVAGKAQGVLDSMGKFGDVLMKPIGMVDRFVIKRLFGACQAEIQSKFGLKIDTEENKTKAGELLQKVILETQQNSIATERSQAMRSDSEIVRSFTMFSADSMKMVGRFIDSFSELSTLEAELKLATEQETIDKINKKIKQSKVKITKATTSLLGVSVFMALIAQAFKWLYNKEDDEDVAETIIADTIGNTLGGLPFVRDVYSFLSDGYEVNNFAYSTFNDVLGSVEDFYSMIEKLTAGEEVTSQTIALSIKNLFYSTGQLFGIPTRNVYNFVYGITKRISSSAAYKIDNVFYEKNYKSDLKKAIANDDDSLVATILSMILGESIGETKDTKVLNELSELISKGFNVLPKSIGDKITINDEEKTLTQSQKNKFKEIYTKSNDVLSKLINLDEYKNSSNELKAKSIDYIYDYYYNRAIEQVFEVVKDEKIKLFATAINIEKLAIISLTAKTYTTDKDSSGKVVSGSKKRNILKYIDSQNLTAVEKYMIMGYLGYSNANGELQVKQYINKLDLSKEDKEKLLKYSGY